MCRDIVVLHWQCICVGAYLGGDIVVIYWQYMGVGCIFVEGHSSATLAVYLYEDIVVLHLQCICVGTYYCYTGSIFV